MNGPNFEGLSEGERRAQVRMWAEAINAYVEMLHNDQVPNRTPEQIEKRLKKLNEQIATCEQQGKWHKVAKLIQERVNIEEGDHFHRLEAEFVDVVKLYSDHNSIGYAVWRQLGVPAAVLKQAGISQTRLIAS